MTAGPTTSRSRSGRPTPPRFRLNRLLAGVIAAWHAGCIIMGSMGCFVTWEIPYVEENEPPALHGKFLEPGEPLLLDGDSAAWVIVTDDSDQMPLFIWTVGSELLPQEPQRIEDGEGRVSFASFATVPYDEESDGHTLQLTADDYDGGVLELSWPVEVL